MQEEPATVEETKPVEDTSPVEDTNPVETLSAIEALVGHPDGEEVKNEHGLEVVVYDYDDSGQFLGWHKELKGV